MTDAASEATPSEPTQGTAPQSQADSQTTTGQSRPRSSSIGHALRLPSWLSTRLLGMLALFTVALLTLHLTTVIKLPFPPFTTNGAIYVDSPEVYTRERLVNDRYDQDYWLRSQLNQLNPVVSADLITQEFDDALTASAGSADAPSAVLGGGARRPGLTFEQRFSVVSGIRDMIRQQILENMLDDRHDLTGNSVYGLKFDTTIVPGTNTRRRAFVDIKLRPDNLFAGPQAQAASDSAPDSGWGPAGTAGLPEHLDTFAILNCTRTADSTNCEEPNTADWFAREQRYQRQKAYYLAWITDIMKRLNQMEDSLFESMRGCPRLDAAGTDPDRDPDPAGLAFYDELTRRTLRVVLGIPEERFTKSNNEANRIDRLVAAQPVPSDGSTPPSRARIFQSGNPVTLPDPWAKFIQIQRQPLAMSSADGCRYRVWFDVAELTEGFTAYPTSSPTSSPASSRVQHCSQKQINDLGTAGDCVRFVGRSREGDWALYVPPWDWVRRNALFSDRAPKFAPPSALLRRIQKMSGDTSPPPDQTAASAPPATPTGATGTEVEPVIVNIPSGLLNFVEHMSKLDAYSYAIFPKNDVIGVLRQGRTSVTGRTGGGMIGFARGLFESETVSVLVGYGDGRPDDSGRRAISFGWVISPVGNMRPTLKTQLALVSVPAWTDTLYLEVRTGWLDGNGTQEPSNETPFRMTVNVPPDFEAFDSIFRADAWVNRGPRIQDDAMDQRITVMAGRGTRILIPGSRLWRSASVTLGAQTADRIRVLPNMEGIIAEFRAIDLPYAAYNPQQPTGQRPGIDIDEGNPECVLDDTELAGLSARPVRLRVWTSEGAATAIRSVCVVYDPRRQIRDAMGNEPASADGGALGPLGTLTGRADGLRHIEGADAVDGGAAVPVVPLSQ